MKPRRPLPADLREDDDGPVRGMPLIGLALLVAFIWGVICLLVLP